MTKQCTRCGVSISTDDWYSFISTKYCRRCASEVRREQQAAWMREFRRKNREKHVLTRKLCESQQEEIDRLRQMLVIQRERVRQLEQELDESF